jgi:hypothetical protein
MPVGKGHDDGSQEATGDSFEGFVRGEVNEKQRIRPPQAKFRIPAFTP